MLFGVGSEHLIGQPLLLVRHCVVQLLERGNQLLHPLRVLLGDLLIGLHVLHGVHRRELLSALQERLVHVAWFSRMTWANSFHCGSSAGVIRNCACSSLMRPST